MATGNFYNKNASCIYAVETEDEFAYEDLVLNLQSEFSALHTDRKVAYYREEDDYEKDGLRSYCGKIIGIVDGPTKYYKKVETEVFIRAEIIVRNGYYSGVNLDYNIKVYANCEVYNLEIYDLDDEIYIGETKLEKLYANYIQSYVEKETKKETKEPSEKKKKIVSKIKELLEEEED